MCRRKQAEQLDAADPLRTFRDQFHIPLTDGGDEEVYLLGNSLGLQPKRTADYVQQELDKWRHLAAKAHFEGQHPWMPYHEFLAAPVSQVVGSTPDEVVVMNSLTTNLHLMLATFFRPDARRHKILIEQHAFPSDHYAVETHLRHRGLDPADSLMLVEPGASELFDTEHICQTIDDARESLALVLLPGVQYYTGERLDIQRITACARKANVPIGWDLAHAVGNVELQLHDWDVDFAVWCSYKYLNSGPGAPGGCFVHERHARNPSLPRLAGWWGHDKATRFLMENRFAAIPTAEGWQLSNPPILAMAAVRASLDVFIEAGGMPPLVEKSRQMTAFFEASLHDALGDTIRILSPDDPSRRGCQLSLKVGDQTPGKRVREALEQAGVMTDWREPNVIRAAPVPLYNRFQDCVALVDALADVLIG